MLSVITNARNDDYESAGEAPYLDRFFRSVEQNCSKLEAAGIEYEYVVVEWAPYKELLCNLTQTKPLFERFASLRTVVADASLGKEDGLSSKIYFEYFAKNIGLRQSKYDNILLINSDCWISPELADEIKSVLPLDKTKFYRTRYRGQTNLKNEIVMLPQDLHHPWNKDSCVCGPYSGDFLLASRTALVDVGQGYDECNPSHRNTFQTGMDGELLWNMYHRGIALEFLNQPYYHINHPKSGRQYSEYRDGVKYENRPTWGWINSPSRTEGRVTYITAN